MEKGEVQKKRSMDERNGSFREKETNDLVQWERT